MPAKGVDDEIEFTVRDEADAKLAASQRIDPAESGRMSVRVIDHPRLDLQMSGRHRVRPIGLPGRSVTIGFSSDHGVG